MKIKWADRKNMYLLREINTYMPTKMNSKLNNIKLHVFENHLLYIILLITRIKLFYLFIILSKQKLMEYYIFINISY